MNARSLKVRFGIGVVAGVALLGLASPAYAAKGAGGGGGGKGGGGTTSGSGSSSITVALVSSSYSDGNIHYGDTVTFKVSTTATSEPHVDLTCSQNGTVVYSATTGYYASYPWPWTQNMTLSSSAWTGGPADCNARLYSLSNSGSSTTLATTSFHAYA